MVDKKGSVEKDIKQLRDLIGKQSKSAFMTQRESKTMYRHNMKEYRGFTPYQMYLKKWHAKMLQGGSAKALQNMKKQLAQINKQIKAGAGGGGDKKQSKGVKDGMSGFMKMAVGGSIVGAIGKKIFDSSPLLKTMMSLFNTSVMLIFRPIGDFIGSFLRPIMLFFMKNIAIPFYKQTRGTMSMGEKMGKQALGFLLKPAETIHAAIVTALAASGMAPLLGQEAVNKARTYSGISAWKLDQLLATNQIDQAEFDRLHEMTGATVMGWKSIEGTLTRLWDEGAVQGSGTMTDNRGWASDVTTVQDNMETSAEVSEEVKDYWDKIAIFMQGAMANGELVESEWALLQELMKEGERHGIVIAESLRFVKQEMEKSAAELSRSWQAHKDSRIDSGVGVYAASHKGANDAINMWSQGVFQPSDGSSGSDGDWGMGGVPSPSERQKAEKAKEQANAISFNNLVARNAAGKGGGGYGSITESFMERITNSDGTLKSNAEIRGIANAMNVPIVLDGQQALSGAQVGNMVRQAELEEQVRNMVDPISGKIGATWETGGFAKQTEFRALSESAKTKEEKQAASDFLSKITGHYGMTSNVDSHEASAWLANWQSITGMAHGGIIREPIFGVGRSGQAYAFGEHGAETVTPGTGNRGGVSFILNVNVGNVTKEADFNKLKPLIQRWILEANSRRGVI